MPKSNFSMDWGVVLHGCALWLCGPEHTLATFQLQDFFRKKISDLSYGAQQCQFLIFLEEGGLFLRVFKTDFKKKPCSQKGDFCQKTVKIKDSGDFLLKITSLGCSIFGL